jgi:ribosomal protein S18 acetylase RimI-like enzyme
VSLNVFESNRPALALYRKLGFAEAVRPDDEPPAVGACYMECAMDQDGAV